MTAGGQIERIDKEVEDGRTVYDVEATIGGKHTEFLVADSDGAVLETETSVDFSQLPAAVRAAVAQYFDNTVGLTAFKKDAFGRVTYELTGTRNGKSAEAGTSTRRASSSKHRGGAAGRTTPGPGVQTEPLAGTVAESRRPRRHARARQPPNARVRFDTGSAVMIHLCTVMGVPAALRPLPPRIDAIRR